MFKVRFKKSIKVSLAAWLAVATTVGIQQSADAQMTPGQVERSEQDMRLYEQMSKVAGWLSQYCVWNHRFPEGGDQLAAAKNQLNQLVPNIPYDSGAARLASGLDADPEYANPGSSPEEFMQPTPVAAPMDRIQIQPAGTLSNEDVQQDRSQPPYDWTAPPGTITAISNQTDMFIVWAAGKDGLPLRDPDTKKVLLIVGHYSLLNDVQE